MVGLLDQERYRRGSPNPNQYGPQQPGSNRPPGTARPGYGGTDPRTGQIDPRLNSQYPSGPGPDFGPQQPGQRGGERPQGTNRYGTSGTDRGGERPNSTQRPGYQGSAFAPFEATTQQVQGNQLMSTHMDSLLNQDSPLMQRAAQQGKDMAASRGLGNSSIAAGNAMGQMIDRAMPIAQFDASRYGSVADQNMGAQNQVGMFNTQIALNESQFGRGINLDYAKLAQSDDHFRSTLDFNYDELSRRDQQFLASIGLDREKFEEAQLQYRQNFGEDVRRSDRDYNLRRDEFGFRQDQWGDEVGLRHRGIDAELWSNNMRTLAPILSSIYSNQQLKAEEQRIIADHVTNTIFPGMANKSWESIPEGLINPAAIRYGQTMPGMDAPGFGPQPPNSQPPGSQPPTGGAEGGGAPGTGMERPPGLSDYAWGVLQDAVRNATIQP